MISLMTRGMISETVEGTATTQVIYPLTVDLTNKNPQITCAAKKKVSIAVKAIAPLITGLVKKKVEVSYGLKKISITVKVGD